MEQLIEWINRQALSTKLKWTYLVTSGGVMFLSTLFLIGIQLYFFTAALVRQTQSQATMVGENLTAAMAFAVGVEMLNIQFRKKHKPVHLRHSTAEVGR